MIEVWKIVRDSETEVWSSAWIQELDKVVYYRLGKTSVARVPNTPLIAFEMEDYADQWAMRGRQTILRCEAEPWTGRRGPRWMLRSGHLYLITPAELAAWWAEEWHNRDYTYESAIGTVLCDSITPIERVT